MACRTALLFIIASCKRCTAALEQPTTSLMDAHPAFKWIKTLSMMFPQVQKLYQVDTFMGQFAGDSVKPLKIHSTEKWMYGMARPRPDVFCVCPLPNPFMCPCNCCRLYPIQACPYRGHVGIGYSLCCSFSFFQRPDVSTFEPTKALVRKARREDGSISVSGAPDLNDSQAYTEEFGQSLLDAYACAELSMSTNNLEVEAGVTLNSGVKNSSTVT